MLNQNGINNDQSQKVLKEGVQFQDQTITYLNKNQNDTNEITNTLTDKPLISPEREMDEDEYFEEEVKKSNLVFEEKNISPVKLYLHLSGKCEIILMILGTICAL
jgi:hypothetical protein